MADDLFSRLGMLGKRMGQVESMFKGVGSPPNKSTPAPRMTDPPAAIKAKGQASDWQQGAQMFSGLRNAVSSFGGSRRSRRGRVR